jgi:hypothetical protein
MFATEEGTVAELVAAALVERGEVARSEVRGVGTTNTVLDGLASMACSLEQCGTKPLLCCAVASRSVPVISPSPSLCRWLPGLSRPNAALNSPRIASRFWRKYEPCDCDT